MRSHLCYNNPNGHTNTTWAYLCVMSLSNDLRPTHVKCTGKQEIKSSQEHHMWWRVVLGCAGGTQGFVKIWNMRGVCHLAEISTNSSCVLFFFFSSGLEERNDLGRYCDVSLLKQCMCVCVCVCACVCACKGNICDDQRRAVAHGVHDDADDQRERLAARHTWLRGF